MYESRNDAVISPRQFRSRLIWHALAACLPAARCGAGQLDEWTTSRTIG